MTYYARQIQKINKAIYPKDYLTEKVIRAKQFIDRNFADNINLKALATGALISKFYFIRLFKSLYGITPHQYLMARRIDSAKHLLRSKKTVSEVCDAVGFSSVTSFTALFKKITGFTPTAFKDRVIQKSNFREV